MMYVRFIDASQTIINVAFPSPQDPEVWPGLVEVEDDDPRYILFINPPPDYLAINSAKLQAANQRAAAQKIALSNRIGVINDAVEFEEATPDEVAELAVRKAQLNAWKRYAVLLGRVTSQADWYMSADWSPEPANGMDLTVSGISPETA